MIVSHSEGMCVCVLYSPLFTRNLVAIHTVSQKLVQPGSPNLTQKCSMMSPLKNHLFWGQQVKGQGHESKTLLHGSLHSWECWLRLVVYWHNVMQCLNFCIIFKLLLCLFTCYPHMPIGKVWIYRLLFACLLVCLFICSFFVCLYGYGFLRRG